MPMDLSSPQGFNQFWEDTVEQFRAEAIDDHLNGGNLDVVNDHVTGPVDQNTLAAHYAYPVIWTIALNHSPNYATTATDQGVLSVRAVAFASDTDAETALSKARTLGGRMVNNVEGSALVDDQGDAHAANVRLIDFQLDSRPVTGQGAQVKFCEIQFGIDVERRYP